MTLDLRQLRHFLAVVDSGNFSAAAEEVFVSQSAVTRSVQQLETALGVELLVRGPRRTVATAAGERLASHARMILGECIAAAEEVKAERSGDIGELTVGFDPLFSQQFLESALLRTMRDSPRLSLRVIEDSVAGLLSGVSAGTCDLALVHSGDSPLRRAGVAFEPLFQLALVLVGGRAHPLTQKRTCDPAALAAATWVLLDDGYCIDLFEKLFAGFGLPAPRAVRTNSLTLIREQLAAGACLSLLPEVVVRRELRHRLLHKLPCELPESSTTPEAGLVWQRGNDRIVVMRLITLIRQSLAARTA